MQPGEKQENDCCCDSCIQYHIGFIDVCLFIVVKEEPELAISMEENQDEEPTKAKKRK